MMENTYKGEIIESVKGIWKRRRWLLILTFVGLFVSAMAMIVALPSIYRSSTTLIARDDATASFISANQDEELEQRLAVIRQSVLSRPQLQEVIDSMNLYPDLRDLPPEAVINRFRQDIQILHEATSQQQWGQSSAYAITITYQGWDPEIVAEVANELAQRYQAENQRILDSQITRTTAFLREQLSAAQQRFVEQQNLVNEFKIDNIGQLPEQQAFNMATLERLNAQINVNVAEQIRLIDRRDQMLFGGPDGNLVGLSGPARLERLEVELAQLRTRYTDNYPGIIRLQREITQVRENLTTAETDAAAGNPTGEAGLQQANLTQRQSPSDIDRELATLREEEARLRAQVESLLAQLEQTPVLDQQLQQLTYEYNLSRENFEALQQRYEQARLTESLGEQQAHQIPIVEAAIVAALPDGPNQDRLLILSLFLAFACAAGVVYMVEQLDTSFHSLRDIRSFTRVPVLATIGPIATPSSKMRTGFRSFLIGVIFLAVVIASTVLFYNLGASMGRGLVWAIG